MTQVTILTCCGNVENPVNNILYNCIYKTYNACSLCRNIPFQRVMEALKSYEDMIKNWTYRENLVSNRDVDNLWTKHFLPSLKPLELGLIPESSLCLDAGSGAGFPGIPIGLFRRDISLALCESRRKRALFLKEAVKALPLDNTVILNCRLEEVEEKYDIVMSRAMGKPHEVYGKLIERLKPGGRLLLWTAKSVPDEFPGCKAESYDIPNAGKLISLTAFVYLENSGSVNTRAANFHSKLWRVAIKDPP